MPGTAIIGTVFVDIKGYPDGIYSPAGRNIGTVKMIPGGVSRNVAENFGRLDMPARFVSSICCVFPDGETLRAEGVCEGVIAFEKRGKGGFGYDPVFLCGEKSFAEMSGAEKDAVSHRGRALRAFSKILEERIGKGESDVNE